MNTGEASSSMRANTRQQHALDVSSYSSDIDNDSIRDFMEQLKMSDDVPSSTTREALEEIMRCEEEIGNAKYPHETECVAVADGGGVVRGNVYDYMCICLPIDRFRPEPSRWGDIHQYPERSMLFYRAVTFVIMALANPKIGTQYNLGAFLNFDKGGVIKSKLVIKVEVLVKKLFVKGPDHIPKFGDSGENIKKLGIDELFDTSNVAGIRIFWYVQDPAYSFDAAFAAQIKANREIWKDQLPAVEHDSESELDEFIQKGTPTKRKKKNRKKDPRQRLMDVKKGIEITTENADDAYTTILDPQSFAEFVVYPLTESRTAYDMRGVSNDLDLKSLNETHKLKSSSWGDFSAGLNLMCHPKNGNWDDEDGTWVRSVCAAQAEPGCYYAEDPVTNTVEFVFPCDELVFEYDPDVFNFNVLKEEPLPFASMSLFDRIAKKVVYKSMAERSKAKRREEEERKAAALRLATSQSGASNFSSELALARWKDRQSHNAKLQASMEHTVSATPCSLISSARIRQSHLKSRDSKKIDEDALRDMGGDLRVVYEKMNKKLNLLNWIRVIEPLEYPRLRNLLFNEGRMNFMRLFNLNSNMSDPFKSMVAWYMERVRDKRDFMGVEINSVDPRKGLAINMLAWKYEMSHSVDLIAGHHLIFDELFEAVTRCYHYWLHNERSNQTSLLLNVSMFAGAGAGKSMLSRILQRKLIPGTIYNEDTSSSLAHTGKYSHDEFFLIDEAQAAMVMDRGHMSAKEIERNSIMKTMITNHMVTHKYLELVKQDNGRSKREVITVTKEINSASIKNTNILPANASEDPLWDRHRNITMGPKHNKYRSAQLLVMSKQDPADRMLSVAHARWMQETQFLAAMAAKMQAACALPACNIDILMIYYHVVMRELSRYDPGVMRRIRYTEKMASRALATCLNTAIWTLFNSEISPFRVIGADGTYASRIPFSFTHMLMLAPYMVLREDMCMKIITEYKDEMFPRIEHEVVAWVAKKFCNYIPILWPWIKATKRIEKLAGESMEVYVTDDEEMFRDMYKHCSSTVWLIEDTVLGQPINTSKQFLMFNGSLKKMASVIAQQKVTGTVIDAEVAYAMLMGLQKKTVAYNAISGSPVPAGVPENQTGSIVYPDIQNKQTLVLEEIQDPFDEHKKVVKIAVRFVDRGPKFYDHVITECFRHRHVRDYGTEKFDNPRPKYYDPIPAIVEAEMQEEERELKSHVAANTSTKKRFTGEPLAKKARSRIETSSSEVDDGSSNSDNCNSDTDADAQIGKGQDKGKCRLKSARQREFEFRVSEMKDRLLSGDAEKDYTKKETHWPRYFPMGSTNPNFPQLVVCKQITKSNRVVRIPNAIYVNEVSQYLITNKNFENERLSWTLGPSRKYKTHTYECDIEKMVVESHLADCAIPEEDWHAYLPETIDNSIAAFQQNESMSFKNIEYPEDFIIDEKLHRQEMDKDLSMDIETDLEYVHLIKPHITPVKVSGRDITPSEDMDECSSEPGSKDEAGDDSSGGDARRARGTKNDLKSVWPCTVNLGDSESSSTRPSKSGRANSNTSTDDIPDILNSTRMEDMLVGMSANQMKEIVARGKKSSRAGRPLKQSGREGSKTALALPTHIMSMKNMKNMRTVHEKSNSFENKKKSKR